MGHSSCSGQNGSRSLLAFTRSPFATLTMFKRETRLKIGNELASYWPMGCK